MPRFLDSSVCNCYRPHADEHRAGPDQFYDFHKRNIHITLWHYSYLSVTPGARVMSAGASVVFHC